METTFSSSCVFLFSPPPPFSSCSFLLGVFPLCYSLIFSSHCSKAHYPPFTHPPPFLAICILFSRPNRSSPPFCLVNPLYQSTINYATPSLHLRTKPGTNSCFPPYRNHYLIFSFRSDFSCLDPVWYFLSGWGFLSLYFVIRFLFTQFFFIHTFHPPFSFFTIPYIYPSSPAWNYNTAKKENSSPPPP